MKAACTGCSAPPRAKPSMVVIALSPTSMARIEHDATGAPSSSTVQAEQEPRSQPIFVPVKSSGPRNTSANVARGSTATVRVAPLTRSVIGVASGPTT